jgi:hypothetical protein
MRIEAFSHVLARSFGCASHSMWGLSGVEWRETWTDEAGFVSSLRVSTALSVRYILIFCLSDCKVKTGDAS